MLNPLNRKNINKSNFQAHNSNKALDKKEDEDEIYCVLCKNKYTLDGYKSHVTQHKRLPQPSLSSFYCLSKKNDIQMRIPAKEVEESKIIHNEQRIKRSYKCHSEVLIAQKLMPEPQNINNNAPYMHSLSNINPDWSQFSNTSENIKENPQFGDEKSSIIFNLTSSKLIDTERRTIAPFNLQSSPFSNKWRFNFAKNIFEQSFAESTTNQRIMHKMKPVNLFAHGQ